MMKLDEIPRWSLKHRFVVLGVFGLLVIGGLVYLTRLPVDAFPDTTPIQVQINAVAPSLSPLEIEQRITQPLELVISGLPGLESVRSISKFGMSQVVATFNDGTDLYRARQLIMERTAGVEMPEGVEPPQLGPISTGLGEVFHYLVRSKDPERTLAELRTLHDWIIKPQLRKVKGIAEVNSWGGYELQYQVVVSPGNLVKYGLTIQDLADALRENNANVGGGQIVSAGQSMLVHGLGRATTVEEIGSITVQTHNGVPVRVRDLAEVVKGHEIRRGAVTAQGKGEAVLGLAFMLMGENSKEVTEALKQSLAEIRPYLPRDVSVEIAYDRTDLVREVLGTARHNLIVGGLLVVIVLFFVMGNMRAGLLVAAAIPLAMLSAVTGMTYFGIAASLLSLGALDFGIFVDGCVVMTDVNMRRIGEEAKRQGRALTRGERMQCVIESGRHVIRPIVFSMFIIMIVFVPVLALQNIEGKMFRPMALTFIFALAGAIAVALFLSPVLSYYFLPGKGSDPEAGLLGRIGNAYSRILDSVLGCRGIVLCCAGAMLGIGAFFGLRLGGEFIPRLSEGSIVVNLIRLAGVDIDESAEYNSRIESILLKTFPDEIEGIWSRIGTAEVATDPMGIELTDIFLRLKSRGKWKKASNQNDLVNTIQKELSDLPGINMVFAQPIEMRLNEMISGIRSDIAIKIYGDDFGELARVGEEIQSALTQVRGSRDIATEQLTGQPTLNIKVDAKTLARHGLKTSDVLDFVSLIGNVPVGNVFEGQIEVPLTMRLPDELRGDLSALARSLVPSGSGPLLPLNQLAEIVEIEGPSTINREWGRRVLRVQCNVRGRDVASFVAEAKSRIRTKVDLPSGCVLSWGGQFENLERSKIRFMILIPLTLLAVFAILFFSLHSLVDVLIIYSGILFAAVGGVLALTVRGMPFSVSAAVGFIALFGIAVLDGQILIAAIREFRRSGTALLDAVRLGARSRLQAVMATDITDAVGFLPMAVSMGVGAEVQRPLATVVVGGILTEMVLTLLVLPALYVVMHRQGDSKQ